MKKIIMISTAVAAISVASFALATPAASQPLSAMPDAVKDDVAVVVNCDSSPITFANSTFTIGPKQFISGKGALGNKQWYPGILGPQEGKKAISAWDANNGHFGEATYTFIENGQLKYESIDSSKLNSYALAKSECK